MTLSELSQLRDLKHEIEMDEKRLEDLRGSISSPSAPALTGMPSGSHYDSRLERDVAAIVDIEATIREKQSRCIRERAKIEKYITDIPDSFTRQIFTLRFVEGYSWEDCAAHIDGPNTAKNLSTICYRYIKKANEKC